MSNSYRRTPIVGNTTSKSDRWSKKLSHKASRRVNKLAITNGEEPVPSKESFTSFKLDKDGKKYIFADEESFVKNMRK